MTKRGFTLIELLVVITILAILAGAALPYVQSYVAESRIAKAKTDLEEIARALAVYETREGEYKKTDVSDLTGRYLNKAPIDPWGKQYVVATDSGTVYSSGPDRKSSQPVDKYDDIIVPYQPPLALVSVKWVDKNQSGAVDTQNVTDQVQLTFSRKLKNVSTDFDATDGAGTIDGYFEAIVNDSVTNITNVLDETIGQVLIVNDKTIVYNIVSDEVFTPGRDAIRVKAAHNKIIDNATPDPNYCISDQEVVILPQ